MPRPPVDEPASVVISLRVTASQRRELEQAACDNRTTVGGMIREAVAEYIADYRDAPGFRTTKTLGAVDTSR